MDIRSVVPVMTTYSANSISVRDFLNRFSMMSPNATAAGFLTPQALEPAVAQFCGYEIYTYEALSPLDSFTCAGVSIWKSLENDGVQLKEVRRFRL
jgi:hypothetical protein